MLLTLSSLLHCHITVTLRVERLQPAVISTSYKCLNFVQANVTGSQISSCFLGIPKLVADMSAGLDGSRVVPSHAVMTTTTPTSSQLHTKRNETNVYSTQHHDDS